jgi:prevent-host-death family protein
MPAADLETVAISEFKATCLAILHRVKRTGRPILVTRRGEPIAVVGPPPPEATAPSWLGAMAGRAATTGDLVAPALDARDWDALRE